MRRRGLWVACVVLLVGVVGILAVGTGFANDEDDKDEDDGAKCSEATLDGTYLFVAEGSIVKGKNQGPMAAAGYQVFNGDGKVVQVSSVNLNGEVTRNESVSATYTVKADCTGTITYPDRSEVDVFIAPDGSMFTAIRSKPSDIATSGFNLQATAKRVGNAAEAKCSEATLHGRYLVDQKGVVVKVKKPQFPGPKGPFAVAGYEVYDGNGNVDGIFSFNFNGNVYRKIRVPNGTYTVKADCTGTSTYITDGVRYQTDLFIAPDGSMFTWVQTNPPERVTSGFELRGTAERVGD
jgi:hypothetical protein